MAGRCSLRDEFGSAKILHDKYPSAYVLPDLDGNVHSILANMAGGHLPRQTFEGQHLLSYWSERLEKHTGGTFSTRIIFNLLDAVRRGGLRANTADGAIKQPYCVPAHLVSRHVQLRNKPYHLRLEERWFSCGIREATAL